MLLLDKMDSLERFLDVAEEEEVILERESTEITRKRTIIEEDDFENPLAKRSKDETPTLGGAIVQAARTGDFAAMKKLIEQGGNVNEKVCGCTALMYAAFYGRDEMTEYLLKIGAKINECNLSGQTALIWAVERNYYSTAKILLHAHANADIADKKGLTALHKAVRSGNLNIVQLLIEEGRANIDMQASKEFDCCTALQDASFYGYREIVQYLLEHEASIDQRNAQGRTALHRAVYKNHSAIVQLLLDCGADLNARENTARTAIHWAAFFGHLDTFKCLLENGADIYLKDKAGLTMDTIAKNRKQRNILDYFAQWQATAHPNDSLNPV